MQFFTVFVSLASLLATSALAVPYPSGFTTVIRTSAAVPNATSTPLAVAVTKPEPLIFEYTGERTQLAKRQRKGSLQLCDDIYRDGIMYKGPAYRGCWTHYTSMQDDSFRISQCTNIDSKNE